MLDPVLRDQSQQVVNRTFLLYSHREEVNGDIIRKFEHFESPDLITLALDLDFSFIDDYVTDPDGTISDELTDSVIIKKINDMDLSHGFTLWEFKNGTLSRIADSGYFD